MLISYFLFPFLKDIWSFGRRQLLALNLQSILDPILMLLKG